MALPLAAAAWLGLTGAPLAAQSDAQAGIDFFEKKIRPMLAARCYACHSAKTVASGGLLLDTREALLKGGDRGTAMIPGQASQSLLYLAVTHEHPEVKMPPSGKLTGEQIEDLAAWIEMGAPDPRSEGAATASATADGRDHWAFQPIREHAPPTVKDQAWPSSWIDPFILARLEEKGLQPAPPADKRTLIRRASLDLTGLPPTPREVADFLADESPQAFANLVDRLLASPHYGERWARHWLDLVRYAETDGHEFDREKPNAWRYRDYVIRAFNDDLPYDRFLQEHIAGDLLPRQRLAADGAHWESPLATGFFGLGEERNAADDLNEVRADKIDNQIEVLGKAFLGLTVACARCHDHKFDPISNKDYYALAGIFESKLVVQARVDSPARVRESERLHAELETISRKIDRMLDKQRRERAATVGAYLLAAAPLAGCDEVTEFELELAARSAGLDVKTLKAWQTELAHAAKEPDHLFYPLARLALGPRPGEPEDFPGRLQALRRELAEWTEKARPDHPWRKQRGDLILADFGRGSYQGWHINGPAFGPAPTTFIPPDQPLIAHQGGALANSFRGGSSRLVGVLTSKSLRIEKKFFHVRLAGSRDGISGRQPGAFRVTLMGDGRDIFATGEDSPRLAWQTRGVGRMLGGMAYVEVADRATDGYLAVDQILLSDTRKPPEIAGPPNQRLLAALDDPALASLADVAALYPRLIEAALAEQDPGQDARWLIAALNTPGTLEPAPRRVDPIQLRRFGQRDPLEALRTERRATVARIPDPHYAMVTLEDHPVDSPIHIGGSHENLGETVPRRFLEVLSKNPNEHFTQGSGRFELAGALADPANPLTARVFVNRVWKHHFGEGLSRSVDNFGHTGEPPTHPELLDTLAARFVQSGWSAKALHRAIVLSSTYRMSSRPDEAALKVDGDNKLLHHMPVRRLEAEAIRDAVLTVTGTLDRASYGPSVMPFITPYQDGRGKPETGPLDGAGRRSVYIGVRRNFLTPMFLAFDYPMTVTTIGRRTTSTVPSQALALLNNEFIQAQSEKWADRLLAEHATPRERIDAMFEGAYARPPSEAEVERVARFLDDQAGRYAAEPNPALRVWADLAHALLNAKEFLFIP